MLKKLLDADLAGENMPAKKVIAYLAH